jgi:hypothetical protein
MPFIFIKQRLEDIMLIHTDVWVEAESIHKRIYYFDSPDFMLDDFPAKIISTRSTGPTWEDVDHTIKWKEDYSTFSMRELIHLHKKGRLK